MTTPVRILIKDSSGNNVELTTAMLTELDAAALAALETIQIGSIAPGTNNIGDVDVLTLPAMTPPASVTATAVAAGASVTSDQDAAVAAAAGLRLFGFSAMEDAATPASAAFRIMHGATVAGGTAVELVTLMAGESTADYWGPEGVAVASGISIDWISGSFKLSLKTKVVS